MPAFKPIGIIHTPFEHREGMPIQPAGAAGVKGTVHVFSEFHEGIEDLEGFSHIILLYHFHRSDGFKLRVTPFMDTRSHGVFATRAPRRPNPIGLSIVRLEKIENGTLHIQNVDILNDTPLIDIKPYVPEFDSQTDIRSGWLEKSGRDVSDKRSDARFK